MGTRTISALILVAAAAAAQGTGTVKYFKWMDEQGGVHYSQTRPLSGSFEIINAPAPPPVDPAAAQAELDAKVQKLEEKDKERSQAAGKEQQQATLEEMRKRNCETARSNLAVLEMGGNRRVIDPQGDVVRLGGDQAEQMIAEAKKQIEEYCSGKPPAQAAKSEASPQPLDVLNR